MLRALSDREGSSSPLLLKVMALLCPSAAFSFRGSVAAEASIRILKCLIQHSELAFQLEQPTLLTQH